MGKMTMSFQVVVEWPDCGDEMLEAERALHEECLMEEIKQIHNVSSVSVCDGVVPRLSEYQVVSAWEIAEATSPECISIRQVCENTLAQTTWPPTNHKRPSPEAPFHYLPLFPVVRQVHPATQEEVDWLEEDGKSPIAVGQPIAWVEMLCEKDKNCCFGPRELLPVFATPSVLDPTVHVLQVGYADEHFKSRDPDDELDEDERPYLDEMQARDLIKVLGMCDFVYPSHLEKRYLLDLNIPVSRDTGYAHPRDPQRYSMG